MMKMNLKMKKTALALAAAALLALSAAATTAQAGKRAKCLWHPPHGCLYPGKVFFYEPVDLPPGWRAYPISIFREIHEVRPVRRHTRVNFRSRRVKAHARQRSR